MSKHKSVVHNKVCKIKSENECAIVYILLITFFTISRNLCWSICKKSFSDRETFDQHFKMTHMPTILKSKYDAENDGTGNDSQHEQALNCI